MLYADYSGDSLFELLPLCGCVVVFFVVFFFVFFVCFLFFFFLGGGAQNTRGLVVWVFELLLCVFVCVCVCVWVGALRIQEV